MPDLSKLNFIRQQGFREAKRSECRQTYAGLMFQPRLLLALILIAVIWQLWPLFLALAVVLAWSAWMPERNPFDRLYNRLYAPARAVAPIRPAPPPRRFAQGLAASFMAVIAVLLLLDWMIVARVVEGLLLLAVLALVFGKFCLGSYLYHHLTGTGEFANRTLPWARDHRAD